MNWDYLAHKLSKWGKIQYAVLNGKTVKFIAKEPVKNQYKASGCKKRGRAEKYNKAFVKVLAVIWDFFDFHCGKLLAPFVRSIISFFVEKFELDEETRALPIP